MIDAYEECRNLNRQTRGTVVVSGETGKIYVDKDVTSRGLLKEDRNDRQVWKNATSKVNPII
jgi:hypothetical protein